MIRRLLVACLAVGLFCATVADAGTVSARLRRNPDLKAGVDAAGRVLLYTPKPVQRGSTHSHFDNSATPNLLMEPSINSDLKVFKVDLTKPAMQDLGWPLGTFDFQVTYGDSAGEGFNDSVTGDARKAALEMAVGAWSLILGSAVTVNVEARFAEQFCDEGGGTLASAGPQFAYRDFAGGQPGIWYAGPLAESLAGNNLSTQDDSNPNAADLRITFNSGIDEGCLGGGSSFYYGLDNRAPTGQISFVTVAMHELGHGLGFVGFVDETTGELFFDRPDIFTLLTYDNRKKRYWAEMTDAQRKKSAKRPRKVGFDGTLTTAKAGRFLKGKAVVEISVPDKLAGNLDVGEAAFGPKLGKRGVGGDLAIVADGTADPTLGCEPLENGAEIAGKIALIDRGECLFVDKVKNAQNAGAVGVVIVNNVSGLPPGMAGNDDSIRIPAVSITRKAGKKIKRAIRR